MLLTAFSEEPRQTFQSQEGTGWLWSLTRSTAPRGESGRSLNQAVLHHLWLRLSAVPRRLAYSDARPSRS